LPVKKLCIDVFDAEMVRGARYDGHYEFPVLEKSEHIPQNLVSFDKRNRAGGSNWLHFYISTTTNLMGFGTTTSVIWSVSGR
jgi:hypothetical protein